MIKTTVLAVALFSSASGLPTDAEPIPPTGNDAYLGQRPPGSTPETFAPGIVSTKGAIEFAGTFSPDGREYYYTSRAPGAFNRLLYTEYKEGVWTAPAPPSFAIPFGEFEPSVTSDGRQLFFASARPLPGKEEYNMTPDIWVVTRDGSTWGEPQHFGDRMFYMSFTSDGVMYSYANDGDREAGYVCRRTQQNGTYVNPENLGDIYPFFRDAHHPCVARDESYLVFDTDSREPNLGGLDLYVSFKHSDGSWAEPVSLGDRINTPYNEMAPSLSPDGKYLFYSTWAGEESDILWVSTEVIEELRPGE
jgi:Tol biopolymer transport system component